MASRCILQHMSHFLPQFFCTDSDTRNASNYWVIDLREADPTNFCSTISRKLLQPTTLSSSKRITTRWHTDMWGFVISSLTRCTRRQICSQVNIDLIYLAKYTQTRLSYEYHDILEMTYSDYVLGRAYKEYIEGYYQSRGHPWRWGTFLQNLQESLGSWWTNILTQEQRLSLQNRPLEDCQVIDYVI